MSINILPKKKQQSIDGLSSQISNIFLLLATFATKYVIMLNPKIWIEINTTSLGVYVNIAPISILAPLKVKCVSNCISLESQKLKIKVIRCPPLCK